MRIAVETAVDQHHVEHQRRAEVGNGGGIDPGGAQAVPVARRQAGDIVVQLCRIGSPYDARRVRPRLAISDVVRDLGGERGQAALG